VSAPRRSAGLRDRIEQLGAQLDAITLVVESALSEPSRELRARWLAAAGTAVSVARTDVVDLVEQERARPVLRLVPGGAPDAAGGPRPVAAALRPVEVRS
jgi:hypothetical protein